MIKHHSNSDETLVIKYFKQKFTNPTSGTSGTETAPKYKKRLIKCDKKDTGGIPGVATHFFRTQFQEISRTTSHVTERSMADQANLLILEYNQWCSVVYRVLNQRRLF